MKNSLDLIAKTSTKNFGKRSTRHFRLHSQKTGTEKHVSKLVSVFSGNICNRAVKDNIDTTSSAGRFFFHMMASLAQMERELIVERTKAGLDAARKLGRTGGRPRSMTDGKIRLAKKLLKSGMPPREVAEDLGISMATLYRWIPEAAALSG